MRLITVTTAAPVTFTSAGGELTYLPIPMTVVAIPGSGGTLSVEYQVVSGGSWTAWSSGTVNSKTVSVLGGPVYALRFTALLANGTVEIGS
jgi:hypothetical protein